MLGVLGTCLANFAVIELGKVSQKLLDITRKLISIQGKTMPPTSTLDLQGSARMYVHINVREVQ